MLINGKPAKAGSAVKTGDEIAIRFGQKTVYIQVEQLIESPRKEEASKCTRCFGKKYMTEESFGQVSDKGWPGKVGLCFFSGQF